MIVTKDLTKIYKTESTKTVAFYNLNLEINDGEFVAIMGPSGCGKTTFLNILGLLDNPTSGSFHFLGKEVSRLTEIGRSHSRKGNIGFVFQSFNLLDDLTIFENIELPLIYLKIPSKERRKRVNEIIKQLQLSDKKNSYPQHLSGGQQQRVAVARAIVSKPKLILADEPTGNLDSANGEEVMKLLLELHSTGNTIIMVTHSEEYAKFAQRIIRMRDGRITADGNKIYENTAPAQE
jgi:putative ABC transport system ATP-binding protein